MTMIHTKRVVVCAAVRSKKLGVVFCGARHFDEVMRTQMEGIAGNAHGTEYHVILGPLDQGFIDQHGKFLTREKAMIIAKEAGQAIDIADGCGGSETVLYSEGLY